MGLTLLCTEKYICAYVHSPLWERLWHLPTPNFPALNFISFLMKAVCWGDETVNSFASSSSSNPPNAKTETAVIMFHQRYQGWTQWAESRFHYLNSPRGESGRNVTVATAVKLVGIAVCVCVYRQGQRVDVQECVMKSCKSWKVFFNGISFGIGISPKVGEFYLEEACCVLVCANSVCQLCCFLIWLSCCDWHVVSNTIMRRAERVTLIFTN